MRAALARRQSGDLLGAAQSLRALHEADSEDVEVLTHLGAVEAKLGKADHGRALIEKAIGLEPMKLSAYFALALSYESEGRFHAALDAVDRGLRHNPSDSELHGLKAELWRMMGEDDVAFHYARDALVHGVEHFRLDHVYALFSARNGESNEGLRRMQARLDESDLRPIRRTQALFAIGDLLSRSGKYDEAFAWYEKANESVGASFSPDDHARSIGRLIQTWSPEKIKKLRGLGDPSSLPVFVVGMMRSGTTLVERIIASHPAAAPGGELDEMNALALRIQPDLSPSIDGLQHTGPLHSKSFMHASSQRYLERLRTIAWTAERITDKMPANFMHLGLISVLFPNARIIHCRRDPLDTCLSCYFNHFRSFHPYAYSLEHLGAFYRQYRRVMRHWEETLPVEILHVDYEDLVMDQDGQSRRLLEHVGLDWDDRCLEFHRSRHISHTASVSQVRQPMYATAVGRHKRFDDRLGPLRTALGDETKSGSTCGSGPLA